MDYKTSRRLALLASAAAFAAFAGSAVAQPGDISGAVIFEGGAVIPEGQIQIYFDDPALQKDARHDTTKTHVKSDGSARMISFSVPSPTRATAVSPTLQIIARLERADGWLLARGSAQMDDGVPVSITLNTVMY